MDMESLILQREMVPPALVPAEFWLLLQQMIGNPNCLKWERCETRKPQAEPEEEEDSYCTQSIRLWQNVCRESRG